MRFWPTKSKPAKDFCAFSIAASSSREIRWSAARQASAEVSRTIMWRRMPKDSVRPRSAAAARAAAIFFSTSSGGSPQVR